MKSFYNWLFEDVSFKNGNDQDYIGDDYRVLVFSEKEVTDYKVQGKTHGKVSHAIKHLDEYKPEVAKSLIENMKKDLIAFLNRKPDAFCKIYNNRTKTFSSESGKAAVEKCNTDVLVNTMDLVNDRKEEKEFLNKFDNIVKGYAEKFGSEYDSIISGKISKAQDLDKLKMTGQKLVDKIKPMNIVKFVANSRTGKKNIILDFTDRTIIIMSGDTVNSMFRLDCQDSKISIVHKAGNKGFTPVNPEIGKALNSL